MYSITGSNTPCLPALELQVRHRGSWVLPRSGLLGEVAGVLQPPHLGRTELWGAPRPPQWLEQVGQPSPRRVVGIDQGPAELVQREVPFRRLQVQQAVKRLSGSTGCPPWLTGMTWSRVADALVNAG